MKNAFWKAVEKRKLTLSDLANGVDITFSYKNKTYKVNTYVPQARIRPMGDYYETIERRVEALKL